MSDGNEAGQPPGPGWWLASDNNWYPPPNPYEPGDQPAQPKSTNGLAVVALVLAVFGLFSLGLGAIGAIIAGHIALSQIKHSDPRQGGRGVAISGLVLGYTQVVLGVVIVALLAVAVATDPDPKSDANDIHQQLTEAGLPCSGWKVHFGAPSGYIIGQQWANGRCTLPSGATLEVSTFDDEVTLQDQIEEPVPRHAAEDPEAGVEIGCPWLEGDRYVISAPFEQAAPSADASAQAEREMALVARTVSGTEHPC